MRTSTICFCPFILTETMPPPAEASTVTEFTCRCKSSCTCRSRESICWIALTSIRFPLDDVLLRRFFLRSVAASTSPLDRVQTERATLAWPARCAMPKRPLLRLHRLLDLGDLCLADAAYLRRHWSRYCWLGAFRWLLRSHGFTLRGGCEFF